MKNACFVSSGSWDAFNQKPSLFSCLRPAQEMQQMLLGLENEERQMEMVDCACAVSDGTGQKPPACTGLPGRGSWGAERCCCVAKCLSLTPSFAEYLFNCCRVNWIRVLPEETLSSQGVFSLP